MPRKEAINFSWEKKEKCRDKESKLYRCFMEIEKVCDRVTRKIKKTTIMEKIYQKKLQER